MARKSFTLRRGTSEGGSYLQYYPTTVSASSSAASATYLRADAIQFPAESSLRSGVSYFEGYCNDYNTVMLQWDVALEEPGALPTPYEISIVYSPLGHPETVLEGQTVITTRSEKEAVHRVYDYTWAYYTMFVRYLSNSDDEYYEPVSKLSILLPTNYGAAEDMYSRIPLWYRGLDETQGNESLRKFLQIFGWDVDRIRTILDYKISMKDPQIAEVETLNNIARDLGVDLEAHELGADRLRKVLDIIGELRRARGTKGAIERELTAIAGSDVILDQNRNTIYVYAQRCNLVKDPKFVNGVKTGIDGGIPLSEPTLTFDVGTYNTGWSTSTNSYSNYVGGAGGGLDELGYVAGELFDGGTPSDSSTTAIIGSTQKWASYPAPGTSGFPFEVLETTEADVPVRYGDTLYFSIQQSKTLKNIQDSIISVSMYTSGGLSEGSLIATDTSPVEINGIKYWRLEIPDGLTEPDGYFRTLMYQDTFTRADSTTTLGNPWSAHDGVFGINTNKAYVVSGGASANMAVVNSKYVNHMVSAVVSGGTGTTGQGLVVRYKDKNNYVTLQNKPTSSTWEVVKLVNGVSTVVGNLGTVSTSNVTVTLTASNTTFTATVNGGSAKSFTISDVNLQVGSDCGLYSPKTLTGTSRTWDDVQIKALTDYTKATLSLKYTPIIGSFVYTHEDFSNVLLERNYIGDYFDGDTKKGGWLVDGMNSISDFRWRDPENPNTSVAATCFSVYTPNYQKTKNVIQRLLPDILPATELVTKGVVYSNRPSIQYPKYRIIYDMIPGFETGYDVG